MRGNAVRVCGYSTGPPRDFTAFVVEAQVAPSFSTGAHKHEKLRFFAEITLRPTFPKILLKALKNFALLLANEHLNLTELSR